MLEVTLLHSFFEQITSPDVGGSKAPSKYSECFELNKTHIKIILIPF